MSASRNRELAADLARRTERLRADEAVGDDVAERLRAAAGDDGKLTPDEAVEALGDNAAPPPVNPLAEHHAQQAGKRERFHELLFGSEPEPEPPATPQGDVGAGKGDAGDAEYEHVQTQTGPELMRVFTDAELMPNNRKDDPDA